MKVLITHPTGNAFVRAAAVGLEEANMLGGFRTTVAAFPGNFFDVMSKYPYLSEFNRRRYDARLEPFTKTWPWTELGRFAAGKMGLDNLVNKETGFFSVDAVYRNLDIHVASSLKNNLKHGIDAVYAYEDGALCTFEKAKRLGMTCFYDLPIGYWRSSKLLLANEKNRWPEWASTITGLHDSDAKLGRKDKELELADQIFVASSFTANSLKEYPGQLARVQVIPYGFPPVVNNREYSTFKKNGRLKLLFVGGLSQRKGIADLFAAVEKFKSHVELTVIGQKQGVDCPALNSALKKHKWIPSLPHNKILETMRTHDVLVFPSLFEGFGLVITEAMSQGTPVITTDRTAGPDLINHGENGWLIKSGSTQALESAIEDILSKMQIIPHVGRSAMETARKRPWEVYGRELSASIKDTLYNHC